MPLARSTVRFGSEIVGVASGPLRTVPVATDASGQAKFCFTAPDFPGQARIQAIGAGRPVPSASATLTVALPASTDGCRVSYAGRIQAASGNTGTVSGLASVVRARVNGKQSYRESPPQTGVRFDGISTDVLACGDGKAILFGRLKIVSGCPTCGAAGEAMYRIDLTDAFPTRNPDHYRIQLMPVAPAPASVSGFDSGDLTLQGGAVFIRK
jgi:hypothetical protein